ncbi:hypothetical protein HRI_001929600 [Hibiscus trionum]|uniref:Serpin domain-containing protein n=1 Tax=Hibiscus trionum TaxID=183268 RepID=A0A9W7HSB3_HIBTR|nr:hypothetical protein HRI_001929600 [Hibiscus trionum]
MGASHSQTDVALRLTKHLLQTIAKDSNLVFSPLARKVPTSTNSSLSSSRNPTTNSPPGTPSSFPLSSLTEALRVVPACHLPTVFRLTSLSVSSLLSNTLRIMSTRSLLNTSIFKTRHLIFLISSPTYLIAMKKSFRTFVSAHKFEFEAYALLNEKGTEAAAVTSFANPLGCCKNWTPPIQKRIHFVADHPFLFVIREDVSGQVHNPLKN